MRIRPLVTALIISLAALSAVAAGHASTSNSRMPEETLSYKVMFKWGLINKQAGSATLTLKHGRDNYIATMAAASEPWADKIYRVRDTLNGHMSYRNMEPLFYEKIANEGAERKHDVVTYSRKGNGTTAKCTRKVFKKGELRVDEQRELASEGAAIDMLNSFYYMRRLPFEKWEKGHVESIDIFSGKRKELLSIKYDGKTKLDVDGTEREAYHITFIFTSGGGKKTSDDMEAWISADDERLPLRLEGKLPVGKVHCILTGRK